MKLLPILPVLLLAWQPALQGQGVDAISKGNDALAEGLWEVAEMHFRKSLGDPALTPEAKSQVAIGLAESLIRGGNPEAALDLLGQSFVAKNPETPFWKAQALAAQRRFADAVGIFSTLLADPAAPHRTEAGFSQASLQLALGQPDAALETLARLLPESDSATAVKIQLYQVEILLDLKRIAEARQAMPLGRLVEEADLPLMAFLEARLQLAEEHPAEAQAAFQELVNQSHGQSLNRYHAAAIGLADAIAAQGYAEEAALSLLAFLQEHPDSPLLEPIFKRLIEWLPAKPALTDPILEGLARWITPPVLPSVLPIDTAQENAVAAWPVHTPPSELDELQAFSLYARAVGLHRVGTSETLAESRGLLNRLLLEYPGHILAQRALYQSARWALDVGDGERAFPLLATLRDTAKSPALKGEAAFLEARSAFLNGDPKRAIQLFDEAANTLAEPEARAAKLQAAIARMRAGDLKGLTLIQQTGTPDKTLDADIELERALSTTPPSAARTAIEQFLARFPDHPRAAEARMTAVEAALAGPTPDLAYARSQLGSLAAEPNVPPQRIALAQLRVQDLSKDPAVTDTAQSIIDTYPNDPAAAEAELTLGRHLFQAGNYHPARMVLEKLASRPNTDPARAQVGWLLAARAAALGGTPKSKEEALILFDNAIAAKGPLAPVATLEKASHLIDMYRLAEASAFLGKWLKTLPENDPLQLPAGLLLGRALYAQGSSNPASLVEALAIYDKLLARAKNPPALFNRLQYLRGTTLEQMPDEKSPTKKRETEAFEAFHSVLETTTPPAEWEYFELCGFRALALLEKARRWQAAIAIAQKIASFKGPHAEEAAARASKIQLEQMIW